MDFDKKEADRCQAIIKNGKCVDDTYSRLKIMQNNKLIRRWIPYYGLQYEPVTVINAMDKVDLRRISVR